MSHPDLRSFVEHFRSSAPYIHAHRGGTFVVALSGEVFAQGHWSRLVPDLAVLHSLGIRLVLVVGARPQIDARLASLGEETSVVNGVRITTEDALAVAREATGVLRSEVEAALSMALPNSPMSGARIRTVSGNMVIAKPRGVVDGIDFQHTGEVRRVDTEALVAHLNHGSVVVLPCIGFSRSGEVFNLAYTEVASRVATALAATKLIALMPEIDAKSLGIALPAAYNLDEASSLLQTGKVPPLAKSSLAAGIASCREGVDRVHFVSSALDGALLRELFTQEGVGLLVSQSSFEGIRPATLQDVGNILALIEPMERDGRLRKRSRDWIEHAVDQFVVLERDHRVIGCAALRLEESSLGSGVAVAEEKGIEPGKSAELGCLAVHSDYRGSDRGSSLLAYIEKRCRELGVGDLYVFTTRTAHWFVERGFLETTTDSLPEACRSSYVPERGSKVFIKALQQGSRQAQEASVPRGPHKS